MRFSLIILAIAVFSVALIDAKPKGKKEKSDKKKPKQPPIEPDQVPDVIDQGESNNNQPEETPEAPAPSEPAEETPEAPAPSEPAEETPDAPAPSEPGNDDNNDPENKPADETPEAPTPSDDQPSQPESSDDEYVLNKLEDLEEALKHKNIKVGDLEIPEKVTLNFNLLKGATLTFAGTITFGFAAWEGPLVRIGGKFVTVIGAPGNLFDGDGKRWWDGKGGNGGIKKPKFLFIRLKDSTVSGLNLKNSPVHGISINSCINVTVSDITFDNTDGAYAKGGHNTDAFDVGSSDHITIRNCHVVNQDDCLAVNSGNDITFENNYCSGGHGISIGSVGGRKSNVVSNVVMRNNTVANSDNGIRIKTVSNAIGQVSNITFEDITLQDIRKVGITIQGNYLNGGPKGDPTPGVPITGLTMKNIHGNVLPSGTNHLIWVANATDWSLDSKIEGGLKTRPCVGFPEEVTPLC